MVSGSVPAKPISQLFEKTAITASAANPTWYNGLASVTLSHGHHILDHEQIGYAYFVYDRRFYKVELSYINNTWNNSEIYLGYDGPYVYSHLVIMNRARQIFDMFSDGGLKSKMSLDQLGEIPTGGCLVCYTQPNTEILNYETNTAFCKIYALPPDDDNRKYVWSADFKNCTATFTCKDYPELTASYNCTDVTIEDGYVYAYVTFDGKIYRPSFKPLEYSVEWKNLDGEVLEVDICKIGDMPSYDGETPTLKCYSDLYSCTFIGWSPKVDDSYGKKVYTAQYRVVPLSDEHFSQDDDNTYTIHDDDGWKIFCALLNDNSYNGFKGKTINLDADITTAERAISRFKGTLDGNGHTLTFNNRKTNSKRSM